MEHVRTVAQIKNASDKQMKGCICSYQRLKGPVIICASLSRVVFSLDNLQKKSLNPYHACVCISSLERRDQNAIFTAASAFLCPQVESSQTAFRPQGVVACKERMVLPFR